MILALNLSILTLAILAQLVERQQAGQYLLGAGIETFSGTVGGNNVTRLTVPGWIGSANQFAAKQVAEPTLVFGIITSGNKWDYYRTDWRKINKRKI